MSKEDLETLINRIRESIDEVSSAKISEDLLAIMSNYNTALDDTDTLRSEIETLKQEKEEILRTNGKLFQQIGFEKEAEEIAEDVADVVEEVLLEEIIDERGEFI